MRDKFLSFIVLFVLTSTVASYHFSRSLYPSENSTDRRSDFAFQTEQKPPQDYMQKRLARDAKPLGLRENKLLNSLLDQPHIKWVIRSEIKHILN